MTAQKRAVVFVAVVVGAGFTAELITVPAVHGCIIAREAKPALAPQHAPIRASDRKHGPLLDRRNLPSGRRTLRPNQPDVHLLTGQLQAGQALTRHLRDPATALRGQSQAFGHRAVAQ
ncbi:MAG: hypothetical protein AAGC81_03480 [Pseudomonadota bacterium]